MSLLANIGANAQTSECDPNCYGSTQEYVTLWNEVLPVQGLQNCPFTISYWKYTCPDGTYKISNISFAPATSVYLEEECDSYWDMLIQRDINGNPRGVDLDFYKRMQVVVYDYIVMKIFWDARALDPDAFLCPIGSKTIVYYKPTCQAYCFSLAIGYRMGKIRLIAYDTQEIECYNSKGCCKTIDEVCYNKDEDRIEIKKTHVSEGSCENTSYSGECFTTKTPPAGYTAGGYIPFDCTPTCP